MEVGCICTGEVCWRVFGEGVGRGRKQAQGGQGHQSDAINSSTTMCPAPTAPLYLLSPYPSCPPLLPSLHNDPSCPRTLKWRDSAALGPGSIGGSPGMWWGPASTPLRPSPPSPLPQCTNLFPAPDTLKWRDSAAVGPGSPGGNSGMWWGPASGPMRPPPKIWSHSCC